MFIASASGFGSKFHFQSCFVSVPIPNKKNFPGQSQFTIYFFLKVWYSSVADPIKPIFFANEKFFHFALVSLRVCYI